MASRAHLKFSFAYWTWILTYIKENEKISWDNILSLALVLSSNVSMWEAYAKYFDSPEALSAKLNGRQMLLGWYI